jgi:hypothetical protein
VNVIQLKSFAALQPNSFLYQQNKQNRKAGEWEQTNFYKIGNFGINRSKRLMISFPLFLNV